MRPDYTTKTFQGTEEVTFFHHRCFALWNFQKSTITRHSPFAPQGHSLQSVLPALRQILNNSEINDFLIIPSLKPSFWMVTVPPPSIYTKPMKTITTYRLCISGHLKSGWDDYFRSDSISLQFDLQKNPVTVIRIQVEDDSELYGVISRLRDLGITLIHLNRVGMEEDDGKDYKRTE